MRVVGLDVSLTSTGMSDGQSHRVTQTSPDDQLEYRMDRITRRAREFANGDGVGSCAGLAVIEAGAFSRGAQSAAAEHLSALRFMVRRELWHMGIPFAMVSPTCLKLYTTGYGKATKLQMVEAVKARHGLDLTGVMVKHGRYDMADAMALAAMGRAWIGQPLPTEGPPPPRQPLLAVKWPVPELLAP
jgi:Holliday junction resolvasome RuvABC endonuclease subunit